jgi:hypothetical protein
MGCDIHIAVEVHRDGKWNYLPEAIRPYSWTYDDLDGAIYEDKLAVGLMLDTCGKLPPSPSYTEFPRGSPEQVAYADSAVVELRRNFWNGYSTSWRKSSPRNRNYTLFGFLSGVRTEVDGAGPTGHVGDRGFPDDKDSEAHISESDQFYYREDSGEDYNDEEARTHATWGNPYRYPTGLGDHSFTHATLEELLSLPWDVVEETSTGYIKLADLAEWERRGSIYNELIIPWREAHGRADVTQVQFPYNPLRIENSAFREFLEELKIYGPPGNVRLLIGYDS